MAVIFVVGAIVSVAKDTILDLGGGRLSFQLTETTESEYESLNRMHNFLFSNIVVKNSKGIKIQHFFNAFPKSLYLGCFN